VTDPAFDIAWFFAKYPPKEEQGFQVPGGGLGAMLELRWVFLKNENQVLV
jgi:hypothetical protein